MDEFIPLVWEYRYVIIVVITVIIYAMLEWSNFKGQLYAIMLQAKRLAKDAVLSSGEEQVNWVVEKAYKYLPAHITAFLSEERLKKIILDLYNTAKDYIDDGEFNDSI